MLVSAHELEVKKSQGVEEAMLWLMLGCLLVETGEIVHTCEKMETCIEQAPPQAEVIDADLDGHSADQGDCDDSDPSVYPGAAFLDSELLCMRDRDGDGFGDAGATIPITAGQDCDDQDARSYPGAGYAEPGLSDLCAADQDGDGYLASEDGGSD